MRPVVNVHMILAMPRMQMNLMDFKKKYQITNDVCYQVISFFSKFCRTRRNDIFHGDIKPSNILVNISEPTQCGTDVSLGNWLGYFNTANCVVFLSDEIIRFTLPNLIYQYSVKLIIDVIDRLTSKDLR